MKAWTVMHGTQNKVADIFYTMLDVGIDTCFPLKKTKLHTNDKPWLTPDITTIPGTTIHDTELIGTKTKAFKSTEHE